VIFNRYRADKRKGYGYGYGYGSRYHKGYGYYSREAAAG
jgi:tyrosine-protein kinase Etk/Wzc